MNQHNQELFRLLKELDKCIVGKWCLVGGGLLGLIRDGEFIDWDNDLDIYLLPGSYVDESKISSECGIQKYYMDTKFYFKNEYNYKPKNRWLEFISFIRTTPEMQGKNRAEVLVEASKRYKQEYIKPEFTNIFIDIYNLKEDGTIKYWDNYYLLPEEFSQLILYEFQNYQIPIPFQSKKVLERHYGPTYLVPKKEKKSY